MFSAALRTQQALSHSIMFPVACVRSTCSPISTAKPNADTQNRPPRTLDSSDAPHVHPPACHSFSHHHLLAHNAGTFASNTGNGAGRGGGDSGDVLRQRLCQYNETSVPLCSRPSGSRDFREPERAFLRVSAPFFGGRRGRGYGCSERTQMVVAERGLATSF